MFRLRDSELLHHRREPLAILREVYALWRRAENFHARRRKLACYVERRLAPELADHADWFFLIVDAQHVLDRERFEIELVRCVVVRRNRFRVAVDHDRLVAEIAQRERGMHARVVELNALPDAVRSAAENEYLFIVRDWYFVRAVVRRIVIGRVRAAHRHRVPSLFQTERDPLAAHVCLLHAEDLAEVLVREAVLLGADQQIVRRQAALVFQHFLFELHQLLHLLDEPAADVCQVIHLFDRHALAERFIHDELALGGRLREQLAELFERKAVEVLRESESVSFDFEGSDRFLERFLVRLADAHDFADGAHLRAELVD